MDELKYDFLTEVQGRAQAHVLKAFLLGNGIEDVELFQESLGQSVYPTTLDILGNVQIFACPKNSWKRRINCSRSTCPASRKLPLTIPKTSPPLPNKAQREIE